MTPASIPEQDLDRADYRILAYGDSNTFGWKYVADGQISRLNPKCVWPEVMGRELRSSFDPGVTVIGEGLGGRTTDVDDLIDAGSGIIPGVGMNGLAYLPAALSSHMPLDLVIIMLGSNDLQARINRTPEEIAAALGRMVRLVREGAWQAKADFPVPDVLVLSPPKVRLTKSTRAEVFVGAEEKSERLAALIEPAVTAEGAHFMDAASVVPYAKQADELHLTEQQHGLLGRAVAERVRLILAQRSR
ncbi:SGNH/GDSL hydrolase family protein [Sutterella sp.]|uniref:SGNH/GDSL hydrolase family protein n=1 Tax=Sutterella sp. TaxID=1981025 RepID=UPI0026E0B727|nr:SGNH/GDSL hydrolase family protein [Sutterella sp.]MDO5532556.1 SGNH/GDSL hydrolase family protein [Sutterella sp.]